MGCFAAEGSARGAARPELPLGRYRLVFARGGRAEPQGYAGSAWRGLFGHALRKLVCVTQCERCEECLLYRSCVYTYIFETPPEPDAEKLRKYPAAPHPFVLSLSQRAGRATGKHRLGLTLFGRANQYLAYVVHALRTAGRKGPGLAGTMELAAVEQEIPAGSGQWLPIHENGGPLAARPASCVQTPAAPRRARIELMTPLRLRHGEEYVGPERFEFSDLFRSALRRISLLTYFHTETPLETEFGELTARSRGVELKRRELRWLDWTRYSSRQQKKLEMGGLVGWLEVETDGREDLWPYIWLGQWTHAGKGTSMGLGEYRVRAAEGATSLRREEGEGSRP